jgi:hypothetical protein
VSLPTAYLTSYKNLPGILKAVQNAQAPDRFTLKYLEGLGYASSSDRLMINVLKAIGFFNIKASRSHATSITSILRNQNRFLPRVSDKRMRISSRSTSARAR